MADIEVENILREIRERVYTEQEAATAARLTGENGSNTARENGELESGELARLESYLTTIARAWDRLPPLVSNRSGRTARFELWLKGHLKRATRWYAWEQINFNAAVHHALRDVLKLLSAYDKKLANQREQLLADSEARRAEMQILRLELNTQQKLIAEQRVAINAQIAEIISELRAGTARLEDEQRVLYRQLALETSEAAVLEDRARRKTEALLEQLQHRVEELEK